jgi:hypothetical protein
MFDRTALTAEVAAVALNEATIQQAVANSKPDHMQVMSARNYHAELEAMTDTAFQKHAETVYGGRRKVAKWA